MFRGMTYRLFSRHWTTPSAVSLGVEMTFMVLSVGLGLQLRWPERGLPVHWWLKALVFAWVISLAFYLVGLYDYSQYRVGRAMWLKLLQGFALGGALLALVYYITGDVLILGRGPFVIAGASSLVLISGWRQFYRWALGRSLFSERVLIVGTDAAAISLARSIVDRGHLGYRVIGLLSGDRAEVGRRLFNPSVIGTFDQVAQIAQSHQATRVVLASDDHRGTLDLDGLLECKHRGIQVSTLATYLEEVTGRVLLDDPRLRSRLIFSDGYVGSRATQVAKRSMDVAVSLLGLALLAPLMVLIAGAVKMSSSGPILFRQARVGRDGRTFTLIKFRSMNVDAEADGALWAADKDPRITPVGSFLRKMRLDELPQLWNVLIGDMSLVGPRPERPQFVEKLIQMNPIYRQRLAVRPGITGWAQIKSHYAASFEEQMEKLEYDLYYIKNVSLPLDISILASSLRIVLLGVGAR
jgi:sugar transferase (PEP-CTERM system associated)